MKNYYKSKFLYISLVIVLVIALLYFKPEVLNWRTDGAYKVVTPASYPKGTKVSLYKDLPPGFPVEIILENKELNYSGTVTTPNTEDKTTVSYISDKKISDLVTMYENAFTTNNWDILKKSVSDKFVLFRINKDEQNMTFTIIPLKDKGMMVTFQYEK